jgi:exodeoxyribonuclease V
MSNAITLTDDQLAATIDFHGFLADPDENVFVLEGYSGCGKTTLVNYLISTLSDVQKTNKLVDEEYEELTLKLTATTNKAAETLQEMSGLEVTTIHSFCKLKVLTDYAKGTTKLVDVDPSGDLGGHIVFIDEASYIDKDLMLYLLTKLKDSKIVFIGDPAQLTPVGTKIAPVFHQGFRTATLKEVVRQAKGNPIIDLSTKFRNTVNDGQFFQFTPDGSAITYMEPDVFQQAIIDEFSRPDWHYSDSKVLAWTNKRVIQFNNFIREKTTTNGISKFESGDYAICNSYVKINGNSIKTDQQVKITGIFPDDTRHGVDGNYFQLNYNIHAFVPKYFADRVAAIKEYTKQGQFHIVREIEEEWPDLRAMYACTVNKSQGSTFNKVFIDLTDISKCNSGNQIARMLYVAVSRAKTQVFLTGDLIKK